MMKFDFRNPTHIVFGKDRLDELASLIPLDNKVLILYGGGSVKKYGTLDAVKKALPDHALFEFGGIEVNPHYDTLMKAVEVVKSEGIDFLLAVGGGSVMDGTKFISIASKYQRTDHEDLLHDISLSSGVPDILPIGTVLTLPATGSEMNSSAVISHGRAKYVLKNPKAYPVFSFLDPTLTYTLPSIQVANGIIDTYVHVCEQYVTYPADGRFQDRTAEGILQTLIEIGQQNIDEPKNYEARANLVWNATMALNGLIGAGVPSDWSTHMIGHELTAFFGIDHAQTLAIIMPTLWEVRKDKKRDKLLQYAERVWHINEGSDENQCRNQQNESLF
jgi:NADP-dependent alcohol dehydrogenase